MPVDGAANGISNRTKLLAAVALGGGLLLAAQSYRSSAHSHFIDSATGTQLEAAVKENKDDATAAVALAAYRLREGKKQDAETLLKYAAELEPENARVWVLLGQALTDEREAITALEAFEKLHPENGEILAAVAQVCLRAGDANLALVNAQKAVKASPESAVCINALADAEAASGNQPAAEKDYRAAIDKGDLTEARLGLARTLVPLQRYAEIDSICSPVLKLPAPEKISLEQSARATTYMVGALMAAQDSPENRDRLEKTITKMNSLDANLPPEERFLPPYFTGDYLLRTGKPADAIPLLQKSVQLGPEFPGSLYSLSRALRLAGKTKDADAALAAHTKLIQRHSAMESAADRQTAQH